MQPQVVKTGLEGKYRNLQSRMQELASDRQDKIEYIQKLRSALDKIALMTCCDYNENEYVVSVHGIAKEALGL